MAWLNCTTGDARMMFLGDWLKGEYSVTELCMRHNISRKTGYKIINRYKEEGEAAVRPRSSARHNHPNETPADIIDELVQLKIKHPHWGPATIKAKLERLSPDIKWPACSTIGEILKRRGLVKPRKYRRRIPPYTQPFAQCQAANDVWSIDFKGQFKLGTNDWCYPLTVTDNYSRYLLGCDGLYRPTLKETKQKLEILFAKYGLPKTIKSDNGSPFAGSGIGGLSQLSIWWIKLGIMPERIAPGRPEQNGRHERMHRTLKEYTVKPPAFSMLQQQKRFDQFIEEYNLNRPHQGLNNLYPGEIYKKSNREYTGKLQSISYSEEMEVRKVRQNGEIKWRGELYYLTELLSGEPVGIQLTEEGLEILYFANLKIGVIDRKKRKINRHFS